MARVFGIAFVTFKILTDLKKSLKGNQNCGLKFEVRAEKVGFSRARFLCNISVIKAGSWRI